MKVIYDISILGTAHYQKRARTGISRFTENVARVFAETGECDLTFCAFRGVISLTEVAKYLEFTKELSGTPLVMRGGELARNVLSLLKKVHPEPCQAHRVRRLQSAVVRYLAIGSGLIRPGVDPYMLRGADIFHSTYWPLPEPTAMPPHIKRFITVHDLIPIIHPEYFAMNETHILHRVVKSIRPHDFVVANSETTKNDLCGYAGIDPDRVFVTPLAASQSFYRCTDAEKLRKVRERYHIPNAPYILSLGTLEPRKNIDQTIRSFCRLVKESGNSDLHLVLVGPLGWDYTGIFRELKESASVRDRIIITGFVADDDLAAVYSGSMLFVYPSFYEGFGLPPLEAMQCGVPVITSNSSSLPEVVGEAGIMVDPRDTDGLCQVMMTLCSNSALRDEYAGRSLTRAKEFSWTKCASMTIDAYRAALSS
jgi:glycosyltransferase involved in cell wall biosynthesis